MNTAISSVPRRPRQSYTKAFKAELIAACMVAGASVAAIAMANQVNANLLRRWIKQQQAMPAPTASAVRAEALPSPAIVPVSVPAKMAPPTGDIHCEIRHRQAVIVVTWPADQSTACAQWLRELMQ